MLKSLLFVLDSRCPYCGESVAVYFRPGFDYPFVFHCLNDRCDYTATGSTYDEAELNFDTHVYLIS